MQRAGRGGAGRWPRRIGAPRHGTPGTQFVVALALALGIAAGAAACSSAGSVDGGASGPDAAAAAASVAIERPAAPQEPAPTIARVPAGTVALQPGPFLDRVRLTELELSGSAVTGVLDVISDVSEIINLEVHVDFYDAAGALVGSDRAVFDTAATEEFHTTAGVVDLPFSVPAPAATASSAVLSIPVLVNE